MVAYTVDDIDYKEITFDDYVFGALSQNNLQRVVDVLNKLRSRYDLE